MRTIGRRISPTERAAQALERLVDLAELIGDRLELVLEVIPIPAPEDADEITPLEDVDESSASSSARGRS